MLYTLLIVLLRQASAICYYPDGSEADDVPCTDETDDSTCCGSGFACYGVESQYFLCQDTGDEYQKDGTSEFYRGSCTDESWQSSNCPSVCVDDDRDALGGGNPVAQCPGSDTEFYCISTGFGVDNCSDASDVIDFVSEPSALTTIGVVASTTSKSTSTASSTATTSTPATTTVTATPTSTSSASSGLSAGAKAGVGVGVSVGVLALAAIRFLAFRLHKKKTQPEESPEEPPVAPDDAPTTTVSDYTSTNNLPSPSPLTAAASPLEKPEKPLMSVETPVGSPAPVEVSAEPLAPLAPIEVPANPLTPIEVPANPLAPIEAPANPVNTRYEMA